VVFSVKDKRYIKVLRQDNGYGAKKIVKKFLNKNWSPSSLNKLLTKIDHTGQCGLQAQYW